MKEPEVVSRGGIYLLTWADVLVGIRIDRITDKGGAFSADLEIKTLAPGYGPDFHKSHFNLASGTTRKSMASYLNSRMNTVDWAGILEQTYVLVSEAYREGEPVVRVNDIEAPQEVQYQIYPILLKGHPTIIHGPGGSGKSWIAQYLSVLLDIGIDHNNLKVEPSRVLYLDYETDAVDFKQRIRLIQEGLGVSNPPDIWYRFCVQPVAHDIDYINSLVVEHGIGTIVTDSLGPACGGDLNDAQPILAYFDSLRSTQVTTLSIDHHNKEGKLYGNIYKDNRCRLRWELKGSQEAGKECLHIGLYDRKRNRGMLQKPLGFRLDFTEDALRIGRVDLADVPELAGGMSWKQQIQAILRHGKLPLEDLAAEMGLRPENYPSMKTILYRNKRDFVRIDKEWALLSNE